MARVGRPTTTTSTSDDDMCSELGPSFNIRYTFLFPSFLGPSLSLARCIKYLPFNEYANIIIYAQFRRFYAPSRFSHSKRVYICLCVTLWTLTLLCIRQSDVRGSERVKYRNNEDSILIISFFRRATLACWNQFFFVKIILVDCGLLVRFSCVLLCNICTFNKLKTHSYR